MFKIGLIWSWITGIPTFAAYYQPIPVAIPIYPPIHPLWSPMLRCDDDFNYIPGITETMRTMRFIFSLNCVKLPAVTEVFSHVQSGFFAAASFMSLNQCEFNFGAKPFQYPPQGEFSTFNSHGDLKPEEKLVLPR